MSNMIDYKDIEPLLLGRWEEILTSYGIELPKWRGKNTVNTPCPCCGGHDRAHWRNTEGRVSLYCRNCTGDTMKSAEGVIQEVCGLSFSELVSDLAEFANYQQPKDIKKAQNRVAASEKRNLPPTHKQDHDKAAAFLETCSKSGSFKILLRHGIQPPIDLHSKNGFPIFPIYNEAGGLVNCACLSEKGVSYLAGGVSYAAWFTLPACDVRNTGVITWSISIKKGLDAWYKTGNEVRICFDAMNLLFMLTIGILKDDHTLATTAEENKVLDIE